MIAVGVDDTDSREQGMCTTYVGAILGERLQEAGFTVERFLLVRCNPAVEHKTRGNAAVALHLTAGGASSGDPTAADTVRSVARETVDDLAVTSDPDTNPGIVVAPDVQTVPEAVQRFSTAAVRDHLEIDDAADLVERFEYLSAHWGAGRGRIGALAAIGAWHSHDDWTVERIAYRASDRWGTERTVDERSVRSAADEYYPAVWDTVDRTADETVCVPHTPGPVLYGIRGDERDAVEAVEGAIESEPVERAVTFLTNQGTDAHVRRTDGDRSQSDDAEVSTGDDGRAVLRDGRSYRVHGTVSGAPETRRGGHVFVEVELESATCPAASDQRLLECVAFEPTKRFRDRVRGLRERDRVTVSGELADGTLKLEKFALRDPVTTESVTPTCPDCDRRMESAGADQGYRCRDCDRSTPGPVERTIDRDLDVGWYEVPPRARRHVAKPLVRGGFDAPTRPER